MEQEGVAPLLFTTEEYAARLAAARVRMQEQGLSALIVTDPANIYYLTGYNAWSFYTPQMVFVPLDGDMILFAREMDANGAFRTTWLLPENIVGYPERYVQRPHLHPFDWVAYALRARYLIAPATKGCVGLEMDAHFFSPKGYRALVNALPEWTLVDCFELVNWVRAIKSPAEIQLMRRAAVVTNLAMRAAEEAIEVGARQCDVAAAITNAQITGTEEFGGDYTAIVPMLPTGASADTPHLTWNDERLKQDQAMIVELAGAHHRYHVPMARTFIPGTPTPQLAHLAEATDHALAAVLEIVRPGAPVQELSQVFNRTLFEYGYEKASRIGYSIGIGYPPDWGERTISLRSEDQTILTENMTFHLMCGMWMEGYGYEVSEAIRVTDTGVETFTSYPRGLVPVGEAAQAPVEPIELLGNPGERAVPEAPGVPATAQPLNELRRPATPRFGFTTPDRPTKNTRGDTMTTLNLPLASRAANLVGSVIDSSTSLLAAQKHDIVRFAMGAPADEFVPVKAFTEIASSVHDSSSFTYGATEGEPSLISALVDYLDTTAEPTTAERISITSGGMQGLDIACKLFVDPGDLVIVESPTYTNGSATALSYSAELLEVPVDEDGMDVDELERLVAEAGRTPKAIYTIPNFQNPSGTTLSTERRERIIALARRWGAVIIDDDPYGLLRFAGEDLPGFRQLSGNDPLVFSVRTFSKILAPGLRVGWIDADPSLRQLIINAKQAMDTCTNVPAQHVVAEFLRRGILDEHLAWLRTQYRERRDAMVASLEKHLSGRVRTTHPDGGFFLWVTLLGEDAAVDTRRLFEIALAEGVAFIPGPALSAGGRFASAFRLCFASTGPERTDIGVQRLAAALDQALDETRTADTTVGADAVPGRG